MSRALQAKYPHLNLRWTMAQMDQIQRLAQQGKTADSIAFEMDTTMVEILRLASRNGFYVHQNRLPIASVSVQRGAQE